MVFPLNGRDGVFRFQFVGNPVSNTIFEIVRKDVTLVGDDMFLRIWFRALEVKNGSEMKFLLSKRNPILDPRSSILNPPSSILRPLTEKQEVKNSSTPLSQIISECIFCVALR